MSTNLRAAVDKLMRDQNEKANLIEMLWMMFAASTQIPAGGVQWTESRRCFFAGAATLFEAVMRILDVDAEPTEADLARMDRISQELTRFQEDLAAGRS